MSGEPRRRAATPPVVAPRRPGRRVLLGSAPAARPTASSSAPTPRTAGMVAVGRTELTLWFGEPVDAAASTFSVPAHRSPVAGHRARDQRASRPSGSSCTRHATVARRGTYCSIGGWSRRGRHPSRAPWSSAPGCAPGRVHAAADDGAARGSWPLLRWLDLAGMLLAIGALAVSGRVLGSARRPGPGAATAGPAPGRRCRRRCAWWPAPSPRAAQRGAAGRPVRGVGWRPWATWSRHPLGPRVGCARVGAVVAVVARGAACASARRAAGRRCGPSEVVGPSPDALSSPSWPWPRRPASRPGRGTPRRCPPDPAAAVLAATAHVLAAGVWAGGLLVVFVGLRPDRRLDTGPTRRVLTSAPGARSARWQPSRPSSCWRRASTVGPPCPRPARRRPAPTATPWSPRWLLLALALALARTPCSSSTRGSPRGAGQPRRPPWWPPAAPRCPPLVTAEVVVLGVAVAAAALLTSVPTAREVGAAPRRRCPRRSATVDGLFVTFEAGAHRGEPSSYRACAPNPTVARAGAGHRRRGRRAARRRGTPSASRSRDRAGSLRGPSRPGAAGDWPASVVLQRDGRPDSVRWSCRGRRGPRRGRHAAGGSRRRRWPCCCWPPSGRCCCWSPPRRRRHGAERMPRARRAAPRDRVGASAPMRADPASASAARATLRGVVWSCGGVRQGAALPATGARSTPRSGGRSRAVAGPSQLDGSWSPCATRADLRGLGTLGRRSG